MFTNTKEVNLNKSTVKQRNFQLLTNHFIYLNPLFLSRFNTLKFISIIIILYSCFISVFNPGFCLISCYNFTKLFISSFLFFFVELFTYFYGLSTYFFTASGNFRHSLHFVHFLMTTSVSFGEFGF